MIKDIGSKNKLKVFGSLAWSLSLTFLIKSLRRMGYVIFRADNIDNYLVLPERIEDELIKASTLVVHVGAHMGEERHRYFKMQKSVIWIEAVPEYANLLKRKLLKFPNQTVICALAGSEEGISRTINVAGSLSSTLYLSQESINNGLFINIESQEQVTERRLDELLRGMWELEYLHLVIDVQGAELQVLRGATEILVRVNSLRVEVSTSDRYEGGTRYGELVDFLANFSLIPLWMPPPNAHTDVLFYRGVLPRPSSQTE